MGMRGMLRELWAARRCRSGMVGVCCMVGLRPNWLGELIKGVVTDLVVK
jgi:hypothetical protein